MAIESIERLTVQLGRLPGIGRKTAARLAYHILGVPPEQAQELAQAILDARTKVHNCPVCGTYTDGELCEICADPRRRTDVICVVSDPKDVIAMEKTREFNGRYHVLFGALSPMEGIGPKDITASYIARLLKPLGVTASRIAHGIPIGGNLEYTDEVTLAKALEGRRNL